MQLSEVLFLPGLEVASLDMAVIQLSAQQASHAVVQFGLCCKPFQVLLAVRARPSAAGQEELDVGLDASVLHSEFCILHSAF